MFISVQMHQNLREVLITKDKLLQVFAQRFVGNPYVWGGTNLNTGADCSRIRKKTSISHLDIIFQEVHPHKEVQDVRFLTVINSQEI